VLFRQETLDGIRRGSITLAFRRWLRPSVKSGGTLLTPIGQLDIASVEQVAAGDITDDDALRAGFESRGALMAYLDSREDGGDLYRVELGRLRADPRIALRQAAPGAEELAKTLAKLERLDARATDGAWTRKTLEAIRDHPALRAGTLCRKVGQERAPFKINVRKLKALGLTESLEIGYRLSPRGAAALKRMAARS
jgi:hypothetical protein